ncbi:unnamed protein product [Ceutorhynchus assimilis]|uniref:Carboxypeptidase n=1 Tax=Ceutorhynchus assimilis TaxID=467358 RepID=A0A9N9QEW8_9CUCU|nr:unnamed protein product [Ceutorhynchus assimilis]
MRLLIGFCLLTVALGRQGFGPTDQEWGYVTVREGAHMFWWLHYTTATTKPTEKPLIIWLQGGPGGSGTEYGNFEELGPWDSDLKPRNNTWVNHANILFVDNPVGTGFSYVENSEFATTNEQIANDFVVLMQGFYKQLPQFEDVPLYIFSESYGGKMAAEIALHLYQATKNGTLKSNVRGVGLGDSWISPVDSCLTWAPYLYNLGFLDTQQYQLLDKEAQDLKQMADTGKWAEASSQWGYLEELVQLYTAYADFYNVLDNIPAYGSHVRKSNKVLGKPVLTYDEDYLMNKLVKLALNLTQDWGHQNEAVFEHLVDDFMKPVTHIVERLLNETDITVAVYNGQLDLIVDTPGTVNWVDKLNFKGAKIWTTTEKEAFSAEGFYEGFGKKAGNLAFYWVLRSGHMVPLDNPNAMLYILQQVTNNFEV